MKINFIHVSHFHNDEHFQFIAALIALFNKFAAALLKLAGLVAKLKSCHDAEDEALKKIFKSALTEEIQAADKRRDLTFRGLTKICSAALDHYDQNIVDAAKRIDVVMHTYGNVSRKPINEETAAIYNLCKDLKNATYQRDLELIQAVEWVDRLDADNNAFDALIMERDDENANKTHLKLRECRAETDKVYNDIVDCINAFIIVDGEANYAELVDAMNQLIDRYNNALAQRAGRRHKKKEEGEIDETEE